MNKLIELLNTYGFTFTVSDLITIKNQDGLIELVKKSNGQTKPMLTEDVFAGDYKELEELCETLGFDLDGMVFFN